MTVHPFRPDLVVPVPLDTSGARGPTPGQARGHKWRRSSPGMYVPAAVRTDAPAQRIVEAVTGAPGAAVTGWAALHWAGGRWFDGTDGRGGARPVLLSLGDAGHLAGRPGVRFCHDWLFPDDVRTVDGIPVVRPERAVCTAALRARTLEGSVRVLDLAAADDLVSLDEVRAYVLRLAGRPHVRRLRAALGIADENVWSPQETTLRVRWLGVRPGAGLRCNVPVLDRHGRHLFTPDVLDAQAGVVGQYDGAVHDATRVRRRDLHVEEICRDLGLEVVRMVSHDLRDLRSFDVRLARAYARADERRRAERPGREPRWTLTPPAGWVDTSTVAARRALGAEERDRWLWWRAA